MIDVELESDSSGAVISVPQLSDAVDFINQYRALGGKTYLLYLPHWYWQGNLGQAPLDSVINLGMLLVSSNYTAYSDSGLVPGWTYNVQVWANGGPGTPAQAAIRVMV
jgi:hypothetical protein